MLVLNGNSSQSLNGGSFNYINSYKGHCDVSNAKGNSVNSPRGTSSIWNTTLETYLSGNNSRAFDNSIVKGNVSGKGNSDIESSTVLGKVSALVVTITNSSVNNVEGYRKVIVKERSKVTGAIIGVTSSTRKSHNYEVGDIKIEDSTCTTVETYGEISLLNRSVATSLLSECGDIKVVNSKVNDIINCAGNLTIQSKSEVTNINVKGTVFVEDSKVTGSIKGVEHGHIATIINSKIAENIQSDRRLSISKKSEIEGISTCLHGPCLIESSTVNKVYAVSFVWIQDSVVGDIQVEPKEDNYGYSRFKASNNNNTNEDPLVAEVQDGKVKYYANNGTTVITHINKRQEITYYSYRNIQELKSGSMQANVFLSGNTTVNNIEFLNNVTGLIFKGPNVIVTGEVNGTILEIDPFEIGLQT